MKALLRNSLITFITIMSVSCIGNTEAYAENTKTVKLGGKKKTVTLYVGEKLNIKVKKYTSSSKKKKLVFKSNNKKVTVTKKGIIAAKKIGSAKVTVKAKNSNKKTIIKVKVKKVPKDKVVGLNYKANWRYSYSYGYAKSDYILINGMPVMDANGQPKVKAGAKKIKYKNNIDVKYYKLSWLALDGADGYEVQRWHFVTDWDTKGHWETIKDTKKSSYKFSGFEGGELAKFRIIAYNIVDGKKIYCNPSGKISFRTNVPTHYKETLVNRWKSEEAFYLQNEVREKAGVNLLKWDEDLYTFVCYRAEGAHKGYYEDHGWLFTMFYRQGFLKKLYDNFLNESDIPDYLRDFTSWAPSISENWSGYDTPKTAIDSWVNSPGHYRNMTSTSKDYGAIAISPHGFAYSIFVDKIDNIRGNTSEIDFDEIKKYVDPDCPL